MIVWLIVLGILAAAIGVIVGTGTYERRIDEKVIDTADWKEAEATIQDAVLERIDRYHYYPSFAFSYSVRGEYYSARFFLRVVDEQADELVKSLLGRKFSVQYEPDNPAAWYIEQSTMEGCEIIQKLSPDYPTELGPFTKIASYRDDGGEPIDLNLDK